MMKSHIEVLYDARYFKDRELFETILYEIQDRHEAWFYARINPVTGLSPDKIYNFYRYDYNADHEIVLFLDPDLQEDIKNECLEAFNSIFAIVDKLQ
jgi:hypothetical protein